MALKSLVPIALMLFMIGCQSTNPNASWGRVGVLDRSTISGVPIRVGNFYNLDIDCKNRGTPKLRVASSPVGGVLTAKTELLFTSYATDNSRVRCNGQRSSSLSIYYTPKAGFVGQDTSKFEIFWIDGDVWTYTLNVNVR
jgi:hypothetical protein